MTTDMERMNVTVSSSSSKLFMIIILLSLVISLTLGIILSYFVYQPLSSDLTKLRQKRDSSFITDAQSTSSSIMTMKEFMNSIYNEGNVKQRKKRELSYSNSIFSLSDEIDSIVSLPNQYNHTDYYFLYNSSIENLTHVELILPMKHITNMSKIYLKSNQFHILLQHSFSIYKNWLKVNLTQYIKSFPIKFSIEFTNVSLQSSGFLTLYFGRSIPSNMKRHRRDLSSFIDDNQLVTHPDDPSYCQVRQYRVNFSEFNLTSWIIEPSSYEMNICSGHCHKQTTMPSYFFVQMLLNQIHPRKIPSLCCKPKRFAPTVLLYNDGPNLVLKRYNNMRVVECGCS